MDDELLLPRATLTKMIKEHIPPDQMRVSGDVITLIVDCCSEFVKKVYTSANEICSADKKATIVADHVVRAIESLDLADWLPHLEATLAEFKDTAKSTKSAKPTNMTDEEMEQQQQKMLADARERSLNASLATLPSADLSAALGLQPAMAPAQAAAGPVGTVLDDAGAQAPAVAEVSRVAHDPGAVVGVAQGEQQIVSSACTAPEAAASDPQDTAPQMHADAPSA